jgi:hypothetical protein
MASNDDEFDDLYDDVGLSVSVCVIFVENHLNILLQKT